LMKRIKEKISKKETHTLTPEEKTREPRQSAQVIDLMEVLRKSLKSGAKSGARNHASSTASDDDTDTTDSDEKSKPARRTPSRRARGKRQTTAARSARTRKRA
ncbi:MAG TPA: hypothetical protein VGO53_11385, partial [Steroidobacteraceae bacterium]|nr:hypothetical protein [Steroidobacteraceae bacterium]